MLHVQKHEAPFSKLFVAKATSASVKSYPCLMPEKRHGRGIRQLSFCAGRPTEKLSSVESLEGAEEQGFVPDFVDNSTKGEYKPGLLVVLATVKCFEKP